MTIASLPMYDLPEIESATDDWWRGLSRAFRKEGTSGVPDQLWRGDNYRQVWTNPELLLSQTCGYPFMYELRGKVSLVATPSYAAPGCDGPDYCSVVIVRQESTARDVGELRGARCAINSRGSQSGCGALRALIAPVAAGNRFFGDVAVSGTHAASVAMVANGQADVAAIDCVSHALLARFRSRALAGTRVLCFTPRAPALPYITHREAGNDLLARLRNGLEAACHDPELSDCREVLMIREFQVLPIGGYERIVSMQREAVECGYPEVA